MAEHVTGDLYRDLDGQLWEIKRQIRQPTGYPYDPHKLKEALQAVVEGRFNSSLDLYIPAYQELNLAKQRNSIRDWGFTEEHFAQLGEPPAWPEGKLCAVVLDVGLDTVQQTFEEAWHFIVEAQEDHNGGYWRWGGVKSGKDHLRLHGGKSHERGLRWRVIDFAAHWDNGIRPQDVRSADSPNSACLWAASYFPKYIQAMDGESIPYMWFPGYELNVDGYALWADVPHLNWDHVGRRVMLDARFADGRYRYWAVPSFREF